MKKRKIKKILACFIATSFILGININISLKKLSYVAVSASDRDFDAEIAALEAKVKDIKAENIEREKKMEELKNEAEDSLLLAALALEAVNGLEEDVNAQLSLIFLKQEEIDFKISEIEVVENKIQETKENISKKEKEITLLEETNKENLKLYGEICRNMYMNKNEDTLEILASGGDFQGYLIGDKLNENINKKNLDFMERLLSDIEKTDEEKEKLIESRLILENDEATLLREQEVLFENLLALETQKEKYEEDLKQQKAIYLSYASEANNLQAQINKIGSDIKNANEQEEKMGKQIAAINYERQQEALKQGDNRVWDSNSFLWPLESRFQMITTYFGYDSWRGGMHYALDIGNSGIGGSPIYAAQGGVVTIAYGDGGYHGGYGNYVVINHGGGMATLYAHARSVVVSVGQEVEQGQIIAYVGTTGWSTGNHLHFEVHKDGNRVNPLNYHYQNSNF